MATKIKVRQINATGTPNSTTYLDGSGNWSIPPSGGTDNSYFNSLIFS